MKFTSSRILYPKRSFRTAFGSVLDLSGRYFEPIKSISGTRADFIALRHDFRLIGYDMAIAFKKIKKTEL